ncbi:MAG: adenosylhomocysteinase, partial [Nitrososphaeraceae archaeon]
KALEAHMDGFYVSKLIDVCDKADLFVTCTGQKHVINKNHIKKMKDGAILANTGHFDVEINTNYLYNQDRKPEIIKPNLECFKIKINKNYNKHKKIYLLSKGRVINLIGSDGHSSEVMALSFANQLLSIIYVAKNNKKMKNKLYKVPKEIDYEVAKLALSNLDIKIDELSLEQKNYHKEKVTF